jgi:lipopolysaccharide assembly outer membrane protein LptD (OstA)
MKLTALSAAIVQVCLLVTVAAGQDNNPQPDQLHFSISVPGARGGRVVLTASTMQRDLSSKATESVMHLAGNVEARMITCVPSGPGEAVVCEGSAVLHADEVDYNEKTGDMSARGNVHVTVISH